MVKRNSLTNNQKRSLVGFIIGYGPPSKLRRIVNYTIYLGLILSILVLGYLSYLAVNLPSLDELINPNYDLPTQIYDRNNELITEFYTKRRVLIPIDKVPKVMVEALLAIEDARFYNHFGIDPLRMIKAFVVNLSQMRIREGASTLTQQTARMFILTNERTLVRKLKEILLALEIEQRFTKDQILELYLNKYYFGHGAYGIEAAAQAYFSKSAEDLNLAEASLIAGLPQRPSKWAPTYSIENATKRRNMVLRAMENVGYITTEERIKTATTPIRLNLNKSLDFNETSYYTEHIRRYLYNKYGKEQLYSGGLRVYTMMDLKMQISAQNSLRKGLVDHDKRQGYRGPIKNLLQEVDGELSLYIYDAERGWDFKKFDNLDEDSKSLAKELYSSKIEATVESNNFIIGGKVRGVVTKVEKSNTQVNLGKFQGNLLLSSMRWARPVNYNVVYTKERLKDFNDILKIGDVVELEILDYDHNAKEFSLVLTQDPIANGGMLVMNPQNGEVVAIVGGYDFRESEFNRAIQGRRQTGSAIKPIVYSAALDNSFTTSSMLDDTPLVEGGYRPGNYSDKFLSKVSLRNSLVLSKNIPTVRLAKELGLEKFIERAHDLGITTEFNPDELGVVIGQTSITLKEMTVAFSAFANGGNLVEPVFISRIEDRDGNLIEKREFQVPNQVISEETSFLITSMLQDVVRRGSGRRAQAINRPSAGKTGTTNNFIDAWYIGYIPQLIAGVYVGFDKNQQTLGDIETGSRAAAPIWVDFMKEITAPLPILPFEQPNGINMVKINPESGDKACETSETSRFEYYKAGTEPTQCHRIIATPTPKEIDSLDDLNRVPRQGDDQELIEEL